MATKPRTPKARTTKPGSQRKPDDSAIRAYLAARSLPVRAALERLRTQIRANAPEAIEVFSYGVPAFRQGSPLVAYGSTDRHCAFYLMSAQVLEQFPEVLESYDCSKGTIRFQPEAPLPATLVKKLVKARLAENAAKKTKTG
ncbi:MAG: DUF1801 domain-containing protein [Deltaproteobacteria bacterium]|nr:DUF1801 domain-containing protein [Deltaproteobacteria bacterium]